MTEDLHLFVSFQWYILKKAGSNLFEVGTIIPVHLLNPNQRNTQVSKPS